MRTIFPESNFVTDILSAVGCMVDVRCRNTYFNLDKWTLASHNGEASTCVVVG